MVIRFVALSDLQPESLPILGANMGNGHGKGVPPRQDAVCVRYSTETTQPWVSGRDPYWMPVSAS